MGLVLIEYSSASNGISPHAGSLIVSSTYTIRKWSPEIEIFAQCTFSFLKANNSGSRVEKFNSMVLLVYYDKKNEGKYVLELPFHCDQRARETNMRGAKVMEQLSRTKHQVQPG